MKLIPIGIRTCERPVYLDITLRSLLASDLPSGFNLVVLDDCSKEEESKKYLFTNEEITINEIYDFPTAPIWKNNVGTIENIQSIKGIKDKIEVVQPTTRKGVRGHIFWCIDYMFSSFKDSQEIIIVEADVVFHKDWYNATINAYDALKLKEGPNGDCLGLLSCYDRKGKRVIQDYSYDWRSVKKLSNSNWGCGNGIGGCMYLVTRIFYERAKKDFQKSYNPAQRSGDTALQGCCGNAKCNIAVTVPSMIQHIGINSLAWKEKGWRYTKNFLKPFCMLDNLDDIKLRCI